MIYATLDALERLQAHRDQTMSAEAHRGLAMMRSKLLGPPVLEFAVLIAVVFRAGTTAAVPTSSSDTTRQPRGVLEAAASAPLRGEPRPGAAAPVRGEARDGGQLLVRTSISDTGPPGIPVDALVAACASRMRLFHEFDRETSELQDAGVLMTGDPSAKVCAREALLMVFVACMRPEPEEVAAVPAEACAAFPELAVLHDRLVDTVVHRREQRRDACRFIASNWAAACRGPRGG